MKYLITGFSGFVSRHFCSFLNDLNQGDEVCGIDINEPDYNLNVYQNIFVKYIKVNLLNYDNFESIVVNFKPDRILHLASYSSVSRSWEKPLDCFVNNTNIFLNLVEIIRTNKIKARILSIGSSEEYGNKLSIETDSFKENDLLDPRSPYAVARVSQEMLSSVYEKSFDLDIVITRSFNHFGEYQKENFVIPSFARQLAIAKGKKQKQILNVGNIHIIRDFLYVKDVVNAYFLLFDIGEKGQCYNVCGNEGVSLKRIIEIMASCIGVEIILKIDDNKIRPNENMIIIGDNSKLKQDTGWQRTYNMEESLGIIMEYWLENISKTLK